MKSDPIWQLTTAAFSRAVPEPFKPHFEGLLKWQPGVSPFSTHAVVLGAVLSYLITIFGIQAAMRDKEPLSALSGKHEGKGLKRRAEFRYLFMLHNVLLSAGSGLLLVNMVEELLPILWRDGLFSGICANQSWTPVRFTPVYVS
jgi:fatty acid elongase 3